MTAATTIVAAMATSTWQAVRTGLPRLFGRAGAGREAAVAVGLDDDALTVAGAEDPGRAREALAAAWRLRLERLLRDHPEVADDLRRLVAEAAAALPDDGRSWVQTNVARDGGRVFAAQGGNVVVHETAGLGPLPAPPPTTTPPRQDATAPQTAPPGTQR